MQRSLRSLIALLFFSASLSVSAIDYFVAVDGSDDNDGRSPAAPFATIQRGVDALAAGDTLIIQPGEYFGSVAREGLGAPDVDTVIRARIPGTVVVRGDIPAPVFEPVDGTRFIWSAVVDQPVQAVNELDTLSILQSVPDVNALEFTPGGFHYDADSGRLSISTTDLQSPDQHLYTLSVIESRGGFFFVRPQRLIVEGITFTGFHSADVLPRLTGGNSSSDGIPHGVYLWRAENSTIRNCIAYLNAAGLSIISDGGNRIEDSVAYANGSQHGGSAGNIVIFAAGGDTISNCYAYRGHRHGMRFYGGNSEQPNRFESSMSWGNRGASFQIKGCTGVVDGCIAPENFITAVETVNSLQLRRVDDDPAANNIVLDDWAGIDPQAQFADPVNLDFRLQSTSVFRGAGPDGQDRGPLPYAGDVYFVMAGGNDNADGLSVGTAWGTLNRALRTLKPGDTLYLGEGNYRFTRPHQFGIGRDGQRVSIRARGEGRVTLVGGVSIHDTSGLEFKRIRFADGVSLSRCGDVSFNNCQFAGTDIGLKVAATSGLRVTHSVFSGFNKSALDIQNSNNIFLSGNIFDNIHSPAVVADGGSFIVYSDYNSYANAGNAWSVDGHLRDLASSSGGHDAYSIVARPEFVAAGDMSLANSDAFVARGPHASSIGLHNEFAGQATLRLAGPFVHSVTATTVNLEWWASGPTDAVVRWGKTGAPEKMETFEFHRSASFSLNGLEPDTEYSVSIALDAPFRVIGGDKSSVDHVAISFRTPAAGAVEPRSLYVRPDGDDSNSGLSPQQAWQTVGNAAAHVRPGDTVWIGGGTYHESVRIRVTGEKDLPITFRSMPGEKVVFDGNGRTLDHAFQVTNKAYLRFDGFYFKSFQSSSPTMPWSDRSGGRNGSLVIYRCHDIQVTRCFHDGRGAGYPPGMIEARHTTDLLLKNNVICDSMGGGVSFAGCPDIRIENNVFLRNKIQNISEAVNQPDQPAYVRNNIFTDNLPSKVGGGLIAVGKVESFKEDNNCYFMRIPIEERRVFIFYGPFEYARSAAAYRIQEGYPDPAVTEMIRITLPEYIARFNPDSTSIAADPLFAGAFGFDKPGDSEPPAYVVDQLMRNSDLDFNDLFATNPEVIERNIGLQAEAFADFHFNRD